MEKIKKVIDAGGELLERARPIAEAVGKRTIEGLDALRKFGGEMAEKITKKAGELTESGRELYDSIIENIGADKNLTTEIEKETGTSQKLEGIWSRASALATKTKEKIASMLSGEGVLFNNLGATGDIAGLKQEKVAGDGSVGVYKMRMEDTYTFQEQERVNRSRAAVEARCQADLDRFNSLPKEEQTKVNPIRWPWLKKKALMDKQEEFEMEQIQLGTWDRKKSKFFAQNTMEQFGEPQGNIRSILDRIDAAAVKANAERRHKQFQQMGKPLVEESGLKEGGPREDEGKLGTPEKDVNVRERIVGEAVDDRWNEMQKSVDDRWNKIQESVATREKAVRDSVNNRWQSVMAGKEGAGLQREGALIDKERVGGANGSGQSGEQPMENASHGYDQQPEKGSAEKKENVELSAIERLEEFEEQIRRDAAEMERAGVSKLERSEQELADYMRVKEAMSMIVDRLGRKIAQYKKEGKLNNEDWEAYTKLIDRRATVYKYCDHLKKEIEELKKMEADNAVEGEKNREEKN